MSLQQIDSAARRGIEQLQHAVQQAPMLAQNVQVTEMVEPMYWAFTFSAILLMCGIVRGFRKGRGGSVLDRKLIQLNRDNFLSIRDLVANIHVAGGTGSGKTSSFKQIARAILAYRNSSLLVLCPKRGDASDWIQLAKAAGRAKDVILIDPEHGNYLNLIGHVAQQTKDRASTAREATDFLMTLRELVLRKSSQGGGDTDFWKCQAERATLCIIMVLVLAGEDVNPSNIARLIRSAPERVEDLNSEKWRRDYCSQCLQRAFAAAKDETAKQDFEEAGSYLIRDWMQLGEKTRASVLLGMMATVSFLNSGVAWKMFGNKTTFSLTGAIEGRKIVIVNMPPDVHGVLGRLASAGIKHLWQKEILRRKVTRNSPISVIWADESSEFITTFDASFLSRCRSSLGSMIYLTQSIASYRDVLPGDQADASIKALLGNFTTKFFFALGDYDSAEYAANLVGKELQMLGGTSVTEAEFEMFELCPERPKVTNSFNPSMDHVIRPEQFMSGLRTGSKVHGYQVDAFVVRFGGVFKNGLSVIRTTFDQRR